MMPPPLRAVLMLVVACCIGGLALAASPEASNTIRSYVPHVTLRGSETTVVAQGGGVAHLNVFGSARVIVEHGADVSHATAHESARIEILGGKVSILTLYDQSSALLDEASIEGGGHSGAEMGNVQIVLAKAARLELKATDVSSFGSDVRGVWRSGRRFAFAVGHNFGTPDAPDYRAVQSMPPQVRILDVPEPSFGCAQARSMVEKLICENAGLSRLDRRMANQFAYALETGADPVAWRNSQRAWLRTRDSCRSPDCIVRAYESRLDALTRQTGDFSAEYAGELCEKFRDPAARARVLDSTAGSDDINNDGSDERIESCWGGTMNAPCTEYKDATGNGLPIRHDGFEWKDYWTYGERRFRYDSKTFIYHSFDDELTEPAFISYVTPANREVVVCDYDNEIRSVVLTGDSAVCSAVATGHAGIEAIQLPRVAANRYRVFGRAETSARAQGPVDVDNDGQPETVLQVAYESGGGRGCDFNYFEIVSEDGELLGGALGGLVNQLQDLPATGFKGRSCGGVSNRLFRFEGKTYYESNATNNTTAQHAVRLIEAGSVREVCSFTRAVHTSIKSIP